jgi:cytochrome c-type biogenesis protein CcmH/NrfG
MAENPTLRPVANETLPARHVLLLAGACLLVGLVVGWLIRGSQLLSAEAQPVVTAERPSPEGAAKAAGHMPSPEEMKHMADKQAEPLLEKLKKDPGNSALLMQVGAIYHMTHQYRQAVVYYGKAVQSDPKNVAFRTKLASSLYRDGNVDGAITELNQALSNDPKDANALFDLGMIRMEGKHDSKGAFAAWQQLLKSNPQLPADRKAAVRRMMAETITAQADQHAMRGAKQ